MALFKPLRGSRASLDAQPLHDGYAYFCIDDGSFHIDYVDADGNLQRKQLNEGDLADLKEYIDEKTSGGGSAGGVLLIYDGVASALSIFNTILYDGATTTVSLLSGIGYNHANQSLKI